MTEYMGTNQLLEEILAELRKANSTAREGAVSSVEVKFSAATKDLPSKPAPVIKAYAGSPVPVDEAIEAYGRALLLMERALIDGWERTVSQLDGAKPLVPMSELEP